MDELIEYWRIGSMDDIDTAEVLFDKNKYRNCLFFVHLSLEKAMKARVVARTNDHAPKIHNLVRLADLAELEITPEQRAMFFDINKYCMAGRYPDAKLVPIDKALAARELTRAKEVLEWLLKK